MSAGNPVLQIKVWNAEETLVALDWEMERGAPSECVEVADKPFAARAWIAGKISLKQAIRAKPIRKVRPNTFEINNPDGSRTIRFWNTDIATFAPDGSVTLNSGGYRTFTTKDRINLVLAPLGFALFQERHAWFVLNRADGSRQTFTDGMRLEAPRKASKA